MKLEDFRLGATVKRIREGKDITITELNRLERVAQRVRMRMESAEDRLFVRILDQAVEAVTVPCDGEAHGNAFIDHCGGCAPRWGRVPGPRVKR